MDLVAAAALGVDLFSIMDVDMTPEVAMLTGLDRLEGWDLIRTPELSVLMADGGLEAEWYVLSRLRPEFGRGKRERKDTRFVNIKMTQAALSRWRYKKQRKDKNRAQKSKGEKCF